MCKRAERRLADNDRVRKNVDDTELKSWVQSRLCGACRGLVKASILIPRATEI